MPNEGFLEPDCVVMEKECNYVPPYMFAMPPSLPQVSTYPSINEVPEFKLGRIPVFPHPGPLKVFRPPRSFRCTSWVGLAQVPVLRVQQEVGGIAAVGCSGVEVPGKWKLPKAGGKGGLAHWPAHTGVGCQQPANHPLYNPPIFPLILRSSSLHYQASFPTTRRHRFSLPSTRQ